MAWCKVGILKGNIGVSMVIYENCIWKIISIMSLLILLLFFIGGCDERNSLGIIPWDPVPKVIDQISTWSPDGFTIAYEHYAQTAEEAALGVYYQIWLLDLETGARRFLIDGGLHPTWSPDGSQIAFNTLNPWSVYIINVDGSELQEVLPGGKEPDWSPDGERFLLDGIWMINIDGSDLHALFYGNSPDWSPDGQSFVYWGGPGDTSVESQIWISDVEGTNPQQITFFENSMQFAIPHGHLMDLKSHLMSTQVSFPQ
jgi:Tol biopolymer transport system component